MAATIRDEYRPLDSLKPHPKNYNVHSERSIASLADAMRVVAYTAPIICKEDGTVLGGHARRLALYQLRAGSYPEPAGVLAGWQVPCRVVECNAAEELKILATDNPDPAQIDYDQAALAAILSDLQANDSLEGTWYDSARLDELIGELSGEPELSGGSGGLLPDADPDEMPEDAPTRCQPGDLWQLGEHRLLCGDSTKAEDVARLMGGAQVDCVLTDPPYGIDATKQTLGTGKKQFHRGDWDEARPEVGWLIEVAPQVIIWGGNYFADELPVTNDWLCWHKKNDGLSFSEFELAWSNLGKNCRHLSHHWSGEEKKHPTQKPCPVIVWCAEMTPKACTLFDPFLGSGTTIIAAEQTGRKCYGLERESAYCDVILARWEKATGRTAELLERL